MRTEQAWWREAVIYQIYVRSFQDSNGDGYGDLPGILARLDYLSWLGLDALWLTPIHPSPWLDGGYDIEDFEGVHPALGTMEDFQRLADALHERRMRLVLDFVPNHTSDRHPWFVESKSGRDGSRAGRRTAQQLAERLRR
jgi:alpha-glucosidase